MKTALQIVKSNPVTVFLERDFAVEFFKCHFQSMMRDTTNEFHIPVWYRGGGRKNSLSYYRQT